MNVERLGLAVHRLDDMGMAVTDAGHVIVHIKVAPPFIIVEPYPFAAYDVERSLIKDRRSIAKQAIAAVEQGLGCHLFSCRVPAPASV